jgi:4-amino-4-deoxy-L-arabinose transferase-like glycosyltransferase
LKNSVKTFLVLLLLVLPALYYGLGSRPVYKIQEVRIAETAREMVASGDWLVPRYNGELRLQKPPLPYWLTAVSYRLFSVNETAVRLPAVLFGVLAALLLFAWARRESGLEVAANTALVLVTSYIGLRYFRSGEADAPLLFFISAASLLGYRVLQGGATRSQLLLFYAALGLGFFTKGPAGVAIPLLTLAGFAFMEKRAAGLKSYFNPLGLVLFVLLAFGWYAWIVWSMPDAAQHFVGKQVDETFVSGTHAKPVWWYLAHMLEFYMPWSFLLIPAGIWAYKNRPLPAPVRFSLVWLAVVFVLLTFTVNKQMQYALLFAPPIAILLGHYLQAATGGFARCNRILFWLVCLAFLGMLAFAWHKHVAAGLLSFAWPLMLIVPLLAKKLTSAQAPVYPVLLVAGLMAVGYLYAEQNLTSEPRKTGVQTLMTEASRYEPLYQAAPGDGSISYYAGRVVIPIKDENLAQLLAIQPEIWLVAKEKPTAQGIPIAPQHTEGDVTLWKLNRAQ